MQSSATRFPKSVPLQPPPSSPSISRTASETRLASITAPACPLFFCHNGVIPHKIYSSIIVLLLACLLCSREELVVTSCRPRAQFPRVSMLSVQNRAAASGNGRRRARHPRVRPVRLLWRMYSHFFDRIVSPPTLRAYHIISPCLLSDSISGRSCEVNIVWVCFPFFFDR